MASMSMVEQLEEQPPAKKPRIDNPEEGEEIANANESNLTKSTEMIEHKVLETSTMDLAPARRRLPLEMNCEIFKCLKLPVQKKFIWGLGRGIYEMFGPILLKKTKRVCNPRGNRWGRVNMTATFSADGLNVSITNPTGLPSVFAEQPFPISGPLCRVDEFPGTICCYYEVKCYLFAFGLSSGAIPNPDDDNSWIGDYSNSYAIRIPHGHIMKRCWLDGETQRFEWPEGAIRPRWKSNGSNVYGCGLLLDPYNNLAIFFTLNGQLLGRKIPISPTVDRLFPAVTMMTRVLYIETNFGDDPAKPFEYDIQNCPGLELACI